MKALTLYPEWAWAVAHAGKRVENRGWRPYPMPRFIALHAGATLRKKERENVICTAHYFGLQIPEMPKDIQTKAIIGVMEMGEIMKVDDLDYMFPWYVPPCFGWTIKAYFPLPAPVPCNGALGLWELDQRVANMCYMAVNA